MRIVFFGASELGWECCRTMLETGQEVVGIFSIPQQFRISWSANPVTNVRFKSFEDLARQYSIQLTYVTGKMSDPVYKQTLADLKPDLLVVIGWYYMLPRSLRALAPFGTVGIHASLLPKYRGGAPLVWALINGETKTGASLFYFEDGVDNGDIIDQVEFEIGFEDTIAELVSKSLDASLIMVSRSIPLVGTGKAPRRPQDHSVATVVAQRKPEDGQINWKSMTARQVYNWVRAQTHPYPGAFTWLGGQKLYIWKCKELEERTEGNPGQLVFDNEQGIPTLSVICADNLPVVLLNVQLEQAREMSGAEFAQQAQIQSDVSFTTELRGEQP